MICTVLQKNDSEPPVAGQWWKTPWGYKFFMQWFGSNHEFFDEFQFQFQVSEIERHRKQMH